MAIMHVEAFDNRDKAVERVIAYQTQGLSVRLVEGILSVQLEKLATPVNPSWTGKPDAPLFIVLASGKPFGVPPPLPKS